MKFGLTKRAAELSRATFKQTAIALNYESSMFAPAVAANGTSRMAEMITRVARRHGVPVVVNQSLTQKLSHLEPDQYVPEDLYLDIAELFVQTESDSESPHRSLKSRLF